MSDDLKPPVIRPAVARGGRRASPLAGLLGAAALGSIVFAALASHRAAEAQTLDQSMASTATLSSPPPQPLPVIPAPPQPAPPPVAVAPAPAPIAPPVMRPPVDTTARDQRLRAPTLIVDLSEPPQQRTQLAMQDATGAPRSTTTVTTTAPGAAAAAGLSSTDVFARRVGSEQPEVVGATQMPNLDVTVPQGATIDAVMETALDSDLPGFARAVVSRDVYSFDNSTLLIPRGSRVIGQYKSGVALGASRIFVIWSRLIRPDGVSIMLASPATDELGRGGLGGKVDRHFVERFGGAILLSVLNGGIAAGTAALSNNSTGVYINSATQATQAATGALTGASDIPPTIRTKPGAAVRIFVARDLDFSAVAPVR